MESQLLDFFSCQKVSVMNFKKWVAVACGVMNLAMLLNPTEAMALDGGVLKLNTHNDWRAFEVISTGENPTGDGFDWSMPATFDGMGAYLPDASTLRVQVNHEISDATISEVNLNLNNFKTAIRNTINSGTPNVSFVESARQAYDRFSTDGGASWIATSDPSTTNLNRFCSGQSYLPHTFGTNRGFVDNVYITGEESFGNLRYSRVLALDMDNRDFYQVSDVTGSASGGLGGMPRDSWENVALLDTGETDHVAILLSPDGGTAQMKMYIGEKGKGVDGSASNDFLARNGLAYGSYYYLNDDLPTSIGEDSTDGTFDTTAADSLMASKHEDVDTSPTNPDQAVLGNQNHGTFIFDFDLDFTSGSFDAVGSGFSLKMLQDDAGGRDFPNDADNVEWSAATVQGGTTYDEGLIFINEDNSEGQVWVNAPDGSDLTLVADTAGITGATESTGIFDISHLVGYNPGSILLNNNQGSNSSLTVLINPEAVPDDADFNGDGNVDGEDFLTWQRNLGIGTLFSEGDAEHNGDVAAGDLGVWAAQFGQVAALSASTTVPEPSGLLIVASGLVFVGRGSRC